MLTLGEKLFTKIHSAASIALSSSLCISLQEFEPEITLTDLQILVKHKKSSGRVRKKQQKIARVVYPLSSVYTISAETSFPFLPTQNKQEKTHLHFSNRLNSITETKHNPKKERA